MRIESVWPGPHQIERRTGEIMGARGRGADSDEYVFQRIGHLKRHDQLHRPIGDPLVAHDRDYRLCGRTDPPFLKRQ